MSQYGRPDSDISVGSWSVQGTTGYYEAIDEVSAYDEDYIYTSTSSNTCEVGLSNITDPQSSSGHIMRIRATYTGTLRSSGSLQMQLVQGSTVIAGFTPTLVRNTAVTFNYTLSSGEADNITDYSNLRFRMISGTLSAAVARVSWAELEVPDAPVPSGWGEKINSIANINIGKVQSVTKSNINKINGA